ncbi:epsin like ENTH VHS domain-containing protein [Cryptosporidium ubiquitum]|uniref:Epsin like ENTH VHS domain-containing protein n=1 Tax=Cryptosporidium ubiquitum TaxID=857276 RepID=A0A1J4ML63_9CRYT|nr:epsin like ENTH VHS domain-containing protein [Cryptosporidium ubiquitum]OII73621.1 epsin like ENTH VHS domain-containing protein [Cryptosporidium ubiquitum]
MELNDVGRLLMSMTKKVKKTASQIVHPLTQLEKWLKEATSNTNWGCSSTIMNEIARSMTDYHDYVVVQKCIGECLSEKPTKWRKIFKTLVLVEYLLKNGIDRFVDDFKEYMYKVRHLQDFCYTEEGKDKGVGIREKSKYILNLMNDPVLLKTERKKAKDNRGKYIGINGKTGIIGTGGRVGGGGGGGGLISNISSNSARFNNSSISSLSSVTTSVYGSKMEELYDPYCMNYSGRDGTKDKDYSPSQCGFNIRDGLDVVKNAGISCRETTSFSDTSLKLPGPPSYSVGTYRGSGVKRTPIGGGIRRIEVTREVARTGALSGVSGANYGAIGIPDESILNAAQKLAKDGVGEGNMFIVENEGKGGDEEEQELDDLQLSDWSTFVAAESVKEETEEISQTQFKDQKNITNNKGDERPSLNPFESKNFVTGPHLEDIERRKKIINESIGDLLDFGSWNGGTGNGDRASFNKTPINEEYNSYNDRMQYNDYSNFQQQENNGITTGNNNLHIPYGF